MYEDDIRIDTRHGAMHANIIKKGRLPIFFIHGLGASMSSWNRLVENFEADCSLILIDMIGHGESDAPEIDYTVKVQEDALIDLLSSMNLKPESAVFFGHSYGGWVSMRIAIDYGAKALILEDAVGMQSYFDSINYQENNEEVAKEAKILGANERVIRSIIYNRKEGMVKEEELSRIACPTKIIWGGEDKLISPEFAKILNKNIKNSSLSIIDGAGHVPHYTHPEEVKEEIYKFIQSIGV
ncbi:MAG: alpha/beta hydrolase [Candidatus Micrarchaeaceae archaeon]